MYALHDVASVGTRLAFIRTSAAFLIKSQVYHIKKFII